LALSSCAAACITYSSAAYMTYSSMATVMYLANFSPLGDSCLVDQLGLVGLVAQVKVGLLQFPLRGSQVTHSVINITLGVRQCHPAVINAPHQHLQLSTDCVYGMI